MERFCDELRWEREQRNVSLETICAVTKVQSRYLQALEAGDYGNLPGGVFRKGILRGYLAVLGLDETDWMQRFEASYSSQNHSEAEAADWVEFAENVRRTRKQGRPNTGLRWLGVVGMFALLVLVGWLVWTLVVHRHHAPAQTSARAGITQSLVAAEGAQRSAGDFLGLRRA
ncbi:MAG: Transcriptional regulator [Acidobacteriaceae bacterium]|nr:Transcriptional regulator [Acidobacteriaceae bacterium]